LELKLDGWSEEEFKNKSLLAPCGAYCGLCGVYIATRDNDEALRESMAKTYNTKPEETKCLGCMQSTSSPVIYDFCKTCKARDCVISKGFYSCHQCDEWPCSMLENWPFEPGKKLVKKTIPIWRDMVSKYGDEQGSIEWARSVCELHHCPSCGKAFSKYAQRCSFCNKSLTDIV
jgi:hypothetical protein